jgi:hypothetical protein
LDFGNVSPASFIKANSLSVKPPPKVVYNPQADRSGVFFFFSGMVLKVADSIPLKFLSNVVLVFVGILKYYLELRILRYYL